MKKLKETNLASLEGGQYCFFVLWEAAAAVVNTITIWSVAAHVNKCWNS